MADDQEIHPWLMDFDKKSEKQKIDVLVNQVKYLESLVGTISVIIVSIVIVTLGLFFILVAFGKIDLGILSSIFKLLGGK
jgi:hypothetical protein